MLGLAEDFLCMRLGRVRNSTWIKKSWHPLFKSQVFATKSETSPRSSHMAKNRFTIAAKVSPCASQSCCAQHSCHSQLRRAQSCAGNVNISEFQHKDPSLWKHWLAAALGHECKEQLSSQRKTQQPVKNQAQLEAALKVSVESQWKSLTAEPQKLHLYKGHQEQLALKQIPVLPKVTTCTRVMKVFEGIGFLLLWFLLLWPRLDSLHHQKWISKQHACENHRKQYASVQCWGCLKPASSTCCEEPEKLN